MNKLQHFPATPETEKYLDHPAHAQIGIHPFPDRLHVVTMLSNPLRWRSRYANYWAFEKQVQDAGAALYTAEIAYGGRPFEVTEPNNPQHLQLRTEDELWHKENALNLIIQRLPADAKYIAWIDADIAFQRSDWAQETLQLLQHYDVIQMFSLAHDMSPSHEVTSTHTGFIYQYAGHTAIETAAMAKPDAAYMVGGPFSYWHPGFAWAARKTALTNVGMLLDFAILGSADWHMAWALVGRVAESLDNRLTPQYQKLVQEWAGRAATNIKRNVGYMPGSIFHSFHGQKSKRFYANRWQLLINTKFDPTRDIQRDYQGLWKLAGSKIALRDGIREYSRLRDEDER